MQNKLSYWQSKREIYISSSKTTSQNRLFLLSSYPLKSSDSPQPRISQVVGLRFYGYIGRFGSDKPPNGLTSKLPHSPQLLGPMRFLLIDRIVELEPNVKITAVKTLTMAEEYLADHFPNFPVMPGVLMVEAMTQTGAWLVRASSNFKHSIVILKEAANVKYGQFFEPAQTMTIRAEIVKQTEEETKLKASGVVDDRIIVSARLTLKHYNLADTNPLHRDTDQEIKREMRSIFRLLDYSSLKSPAKKVPVTNE